MNEAAAREVLLLRAFESTGIAAWTDEDRLWASRAALQAVGNDAPADTFLSTRAQLGLRKLAPHDPLLARWQSRRTWHVEALLTVAVLGLLAGLLVDRIGSAQRINLLAPPVWALIAWNLVVYAWLLMRALSGSKAPGRLRGAVSAWLRRWRTRHLGQRAGANVAVWNTFAADWATFSLPLNTARIALALHLGAAALATGVMAGMYLRGLVLDYRVGWQSTFLDATTVHGVLTTLLAPAAALAGIGLPDAAGFQALRVEPGALAHGAASAAPWIHLYAVTLLVLVVFPRLALALWTAWRARKLREHFALPLQEPYFQRLRGLQHGQGMRVRVWPHAHTPDAAAQAAMGRLFARVFGDGVRWQVAHTVAHGDEDDPLNLPTEGTLRVALFELGATPEAENQGRLLQALSASAAAPVLALVDEAAFLQRFGADSPRLPARRQAWSDLAASMGASPVCLDLRAPDLGAAEAALQAALVPVPASPPEAAT